MLIDLFNRYIWLVDTIYSAGAISREEINRRWSRSRYNEKHEDAIPERTFHHDREAILLMFHVDIQCDKRRNVYYIDNASDLQQDGLRRWMLSSFTVKQMVDESEILRDQIIYEEIPSGQQDLTKFVSAMRDHLRLRITHDSFKGKSYTTIISPFCLKVFKQRWYVAGITDQYPDEIRVYALDRLHDIQLTEQTYALPNGFTAKDLFRYSYGVYCSETPAQIVVKVAAGSVPFIRTVPLHESQQEIEHHEEYSLFQYYLAPTPDFKMELRTLGADAEVLSPASFRQEFVDDILRLNHTYGL